MSPKVEYRIIFIDKKSEGVDYDSNNFDKIYSLIDGDLIVQDISEDEGIFDEDVLADQINQLDSNIFNLIFLHTIGGEYQINIEDQVENNKNICLFHMSRGRINLLSDYHTLQYKQEGICSFSNFEPQQIREMFNLQNSPISKYIDKLLRNKTPNKDSIVSEFYTLFEDTSKDDFKDKEKNKIKLIENYFLEALEVISEGKDNKNLVKLANELQDKYELKLIKSE